MIKKWGITEAQFDEIMAAPIVSHDVYGYDKLPWYYAVLTKIELIYKYQIKKRLKAIFSR
ncbi:MAG: hypothetical protein H0W50_11220 [Parachlamydiaceae bacterium]|nr:hypothetical protein [Parachlamydiaceae bacterium]